MDPETTALTCPRCKPAAVGAYRAAAEGLRATAQLEADVWEADIEVQRCPKCDGVWLDEGQLDRIVRTQGNDYSLVDPLHAADQRQRAAAVSAQALEDEAEPDCPACGTALIRGEYRRSLVTIATCLTCGGSWLDAEALRRIEIYSETLVR